MCVCQPAGFLKLLLFKRQYVGLINSHWCDSSFAAFSTEAFQLVYMAFAINNVNGCGLSNAAHHKYLPRRLR